MLIDILADENRRVYVRSKLIPRMEWKAMKGEEKAVSLARWRERWDASSKRWTDRLIPSL